MAVTSTNNLRKGMKDTNGSTDILDLQKALNATGYGYNLAEDGSFGGKTLAAVKDYQKRSGLAVDGIVGTNTWGALTKASSSATTTPTETTTPATPEETQAPTFEYTPYTPSDTVKQAEELLKQQLANKPGAYTSPWQSQLNDIIQQIQNREKFSYDLNADALYQQYKDQYTTQGKMAMMDTMGQAQAMTGGYGNSYAQTAGQQAYQGQLQQLNDKIPELYQLALSQYNKEGDDMYNQASLIAGMEEQDYGRYRDQVSDYYTEVNRLTDESRYQGEQDYGKWADEQSFGYQQYRDQIADQQWQAQFDEAKRQYDESVALSKKSSSGSSSGGSGGGSKANNGSRTTDQIKEMQKALGVTADGKWGPKTQAAAKAKWGTTSADDAWTKYGSGGGGTPTTPVDTENTKLFRASIMTSTEFARHGNKATVKGKTYTSYKSYIEACLADWTDNDVPKLGRNLTDEEVSFLMDYYGL